MSTITYWFNLVKYYDFPLSRLSRATTLANRSIKPWRSDSERCSMRPCSHSSTFITTMLRRLGFLTVITTCVVSFTRPTAALEIIFNNPAVPDCVVGINDLQIGGQNYNVQFVIGTFSGLFDPTLALCLLLPGLVLGNDYRAELLYFTTDGKPNGPSLFPGFKNASVWSAIGTSSMGNLYIAVSNHQQPLSPADVHGNVAIYKYDPVQGRMSFLNDLKSVSTAANNWMPDESIYKVHSFLLENSNRQMYFTSYEHAPTYFLRGSHLYTIDIDTDIVRDHSKTQPFTMTKDFRMIPNILEPSTTSGVLIEHHGLKGIALNSNMPGLIYAVTYEAKDTEPDGYIIKYDLNTGVIEKIPAGPLASRSRDISYVMIVDNTGNLYFLQQSGRYYDLMKYSIITDSVKTIKERLTESPEGEHSISGGFSIIAPTKSYSKIYCVTYAGKLFRLTPSEDKIEFLRSLPDMTYPNMANMVISPNNKSLYYLNLSSTPDFQAGKVGVFKCNTDNFRCEKVLNVSNIIRTRDLSFGGINTWDRNGNFYVPVWPWATDEPLAILKVSTPERYEDDGGED